MNVRIFWVRAMKCMCAQTRPRFILSSEGVFWGMEFEPMLTPREKSPLPENVPRGGSNPRHCGSEPKHYQLSYSGPMVRWFFILGSALADLSQLRTRKRQPCTDSTEYYQLQSMQLWPEVHYNGVFGLVFAVVLLVHLSGACFRFFLPGFELKLSVCAFLQESCALKCAVIDVLYWYIINDVCASCVCCCRSIYSYCLWRFSVFTFSYCVCMSRLACSPILSVCSTLLC